MKKKMLFVPSAGYKTVLGDINSLVDRCKDKFDCYIAIKDIETDSFLEEDGVFFVEFNSSFYQYLVYTSEYIIDSGAIKSSMRVFNDSKWINLWHGIPIKKMMLDEGLPPENYINDFRRYDYFISSSPYYTDILRNSFLYNGNILELGSPRYDSLFESKKNDIIEELNIDPNKKTILYSPTFRERGKLEIPFNIKKLLNDCPNSQIIIKPHYLNELKRNDLKIPGVIDASDVSEINELFKVVDVLISDYSSLIFDYSLLNKDMILYHYDYDKYRDERGFYFELKDYFSDNIVYNEDDLIEMINTTPKINYKKFKNDFLPFENGDTSERIFNNLLTDNAKYTGKEVIFLVNQLNEIGGVHNFIQTMAKNLKEKHNRKIILIATADEFYNNRQGIQFESDYIDIILTPSINRNAIHKILENTDGVIISVQMWAHKYYQKFLEGKNVISMFHTDINYASKKPEEFTWEIEEIESGEYANVKSYVMLSKKNAEKLKKYTPENIRVSYIENGIQLSEDKTDFSGNFVFLARIENAQKNVFELISIGKKLKEIGSKAKIDVYGDGPEKKEFLDAIKDNKLENTIIYKGYTNDPYSIFKTAKALVMCSRYEGLPYTILESMNIGVPSLVYNTFSAAEDMITDGKNGFLFEEGSTLEMAIAIDKLENDRDMLEKMSKESKIKSKYYDYNKIIDRWISEFNIIDTLISNKPKKSRNKRPNIIKRKLANIRKQALDGSYKITYDRKKILRKIRNVIIETYKLTFLYKNYYNQNLVPEFFKPAYRELSINDDLGKVSIIVPAYNEEKRIGTAIKSLLKQTYSNIEIIIVDDGSKDKTKESVELFKDERVKYFYKENSGLGLTRNHGVSVSTGDYIFFMDSDDTIPKDAIKDLVFPLLAYDLEVVCGKTYREYVETKEIESWMNYLYGRFNITNVSDDLSLLGDTLSTNKLYRKDIFDLYNLYFEKGLYEDKFFVFNLHQKIKNIGIVDKHVYNWKVYGNNTSISTTKDVNDFRERTDRFEEVYSLAKSDKIRFKLIDLYITHEIKVYINIFGELSKEDQINIFNIAEKALLEKWDKFDINSIWRGINYYAAYTIKSGKKDDFIRVCNANYNNKEENEK